MPPSKGAFDGAIFSPGELYAYPRTVMQKGSTMNSSSTRETGERNRLTSPEKSYNEQRETLINAIKPMEFLSAPCVYLDRQLLSLILTRIHLFEKILEVQGNIVECGVYKGNSLILYQHLSSIYEPYNMNRKVIGFDTFEGFPEFAEVDKGLPVREGDSNDVDYEQLYTWARLHDQNRPVGHIPKVELIKGNALETIPAYVAENPHLIIALLYLDFNLYEPTKTALQHLLPLVPKGGVVGFDEINQKRFPGETLALKEEITLSAVKMRRFFYDPHVSYYIVE